MAKSEEFITSLPDWANKYIDVCLASTKEIATNSGVKDVKERHIPTIAFFLNIRMPRNCGDTMARDTYYTWLNGTDTQKSDTIKRIDTKFQALAVDIVANEGKGIFYAKNKLGMTDKVEAKNENTNLNTTVEIIKSDAPLSSNEKDISLD